MITIDGVMGRCFAVLGLGRTGMATALSLEASGVEVRVWDDAVEKRDAAKALGFKICKFNDHTDWNSVSLLLVSPGISHLYPVPHPVVVSAIHAGVPLDNDIGLFFSSLRKLEKRPRIIAITGSNGKSTTASLVDSLLSTNSIKSCLVGNIGQPVFATTLLNSDETVVLELSSFQTELAQILEPDIAIFLNLSPDHLDRHAGHGGYFAAKRRLFSSPHTKTHIIGIDQIEGQFLAAQSEADKVVRISAQHNLSNYQESVFVEDGHLVVQANDQLETICDLRNISSLTGRHNQQNACAAFAACSALGMMHEDIAKGLVKFLGLPHRSQIVGKYSDILFVNDSKATNAESASMSLDSFPRIRWIAGGMGKEGGIASLSERMGNVKKAYFIGQSANDFALQIGNIPYAVCETIPNALKMAIADAHPGDTVLLAPAAASFDQYQDFEARGEHFSSEVKRIFQDK